MNFDADSGIKRRLIHFEFRNKFVAQQDLEKERLNHKMVKYLHWIILSLASSTITMTTKMLSFTYF